MKKKLVVEYWSSTGKLSALPAKYYLARQKWLCEIIFENPDGEVDEFEVKPACKMLLLDLLPFLNEQLDVLVPIDAVDCGFRIYRYTNTQLGTRR